MKITWLGQAGLLFEDGSFSIMIDPYLSNSVVKVEPKNDRRVPVNERFLSLTPDVMIFTHDHLDHYDPETAPVFLSRKETCMTVLCPTTVWTKARQNGHHNYVQFNRHTVWTQGDYRFTSVKAVHSDPYAIGVLVEDMKKSKLYYVTGDTLYNEDIFADIPKTVDVLFLPVNGVGNNMNMADANAFAKRIGARTVVPFHFGMFDSLVPTGFDPENIVVPTVYQEIVIQ